MAFDIDAVEVPLTSDVPDRRAEGLVRRLVVNENFGLPRVTPVTEIPQVELGYEMMICFLGHV